MKPEILIKKLPLGDYQANCYVVSRADTGDAVVIDAPGRAEDILSAVRGLRVSCIALTHTHPDHIEALDELRLRLAAPLVVHVDDAGSVSPCPQRLLRHNDLVTLGDISLKVIHTPGHTPGSICLLHGDSLFSGDTLFPGGPGKTGSPAGFRRIVDSITRRLFTLPDGTQVYPGHGPDTVLGKEKKEFAAFAARPHPAGLCGDVVWLTS